MIDLKRLRLYPAVTNSIAFTNDIDEVNKSELSYNIIFYPENTSFSMAYPKLNIQRRFVRFGTILQNMMPRIIVNPQSLTQFFSNHILPIKRDRPGLTNMFIDTSYFFDKLDLKYKKQSYRRPVVLTKIFQYLGTAKTDYPNRKNVLMYHIDQTQPIPEDFWMKRAFILFMMFRSKEPLPFEYVVLSVYDGKTTKYQLLARPEKRVSYGRLYSIINSIRQITLSDDMTNRDTKTDEFSHHVVKSATMSPDAVEEIPEVITNKTKTLVSSFIKRLAPETQNYLTSKTLSAPQAQNLVIKSTIFNLTRDIKKTDEIVNKMDPIKYQSIIKSIKTELEPSILVADTYKNESRDEVFKNVNILGINDDKEPSKILNKRNIDFQESFESDLFRSFKILESKKTFPLKVVKFTKIRVPVDPGDLEPTRMIKYSVTLRDDTNKDHIIDIDIPEIQKDGTFLINGSKKYLIYQIIIDPIFFLKQGEAVLQTMYASVATHHKETKHKSYFTSHIAGYWVPTSLLLSYTVGFDNMCKMFGIEYSIVDQKPETGKYFEFSDGKYAVFQFKTREALILLNSLNEIHHDMKSTDINEKHAIQDILIKETGSRNSIFQIDSVLDNIMEPIAMQILKTKLLPTTFSGCISYICKGLAEGRKDKRNDISKQRIRSSEIFNYQIQKQILGSYNDYRTKREHGDTDASYFCDTKQIVGRIVNISRMMRPLENINPYEELSCMTRVTPIGDGGVSDGHGITKDARNIDTSYYGNFDPMDTPENDAVGVINHLTIDAAIGNARGSIGKFDITKDIGASTLSTTTAVVPFVSSDDGCRVMLGASQCRQSIPVLGGEQPLVQTGYETIMTSMLSDSYIRKSPVSGDVVKQTPNAVYVKDAKTGKVNIVPLDSRLLKSAQGKSSINYFTSTVKIGQKVKSGQIVAEGKHIKDGVISIGSNLLVAVMGWKGFGFDDGYIISESVANKKFVSTSYEEITVDIKTTSTIKYIIPEGTLTKKGDVILRRSSKEVEDLLNVDESELIEGQQVKRSPGGKIVAVEIYPNVSIKKFPLLEPAYINFRSKWEEIKGTFPEKFLVNDQGTKSAFSGVRIVIKIERYDMCGVGDKITNHHGGKGVLTLIEKDENMPLSPWGERIEVMLNPIAVINRMNPGTLYEMYTGMIAKTTARNLCSLGYKKTPKGMKLLATVYTTMDNTDGKVLSRNIIKSFVDMPDKVYAEYIQKLEKTNYILPILVPQFKAPTKEMIFKTMTLLGLKSGYRLKLPEYGVMTQNEVALGYLYYKKLEHQAEYKIGARSVGKYDEKTAQPTAGKQQGGGQRLGEFDLWSLASHGAETVMKELLGPLSDDQKTKNEIIHNIIQTGSASYMEPKSGRSKSLLDVYMASMMLDVKL